MKLFLVYIFYYAGDIISRTTMQWFNGFGYGLYSKLMLWSVDLDTESKIWKSPKDNNYE
jgi:hypothetical protein